MLKLKTREYSVAGKHEPDKEIFHNKSKLPKSTQEKLKHSPISEAQYLAMLAYSKWLPRGKRMLKLNYADLRDTLLAHESEKTPMTDTGGLNAGGTISKTNNKSKILK